MREWRALFVVGLVVLVLGCAADLQEKWNALSPGDQAKIILNQAQDQLTDSFRIGRDYVKSRPEFDGVWKSQIVPGFDVANKSILAALNMAGTGVVTPEKVYAEVMPLVKAVLDKLVEIGAIKK